MTHAVELEGVTKSFGSQVAVNNLDLVVPRGAIHGFVGPNGSGKTTALRIILRIFQQDRGRVTVLGDDRSPPADPRLGYLPEERGLYKRMKVRDLLTFYASLKGVADIRSALQRWLTQLDAESFANKRVDALSKGMAQKIQFITAVIGEPELLILDEPFSGLDPVNMEVLRDAVLQLRDSGTTVIFSTHDMEVAQQLCDSVFMIFRGDKVLDGTLGEIQRNYPCNEVQVQLSGELPSELPGVSHIERNGSGYVLRLQEQASSDQLLAAVAPLGVQHFEVRRPTLRDIFVQIAKPAPEEMQ